MPTRFSRTTRSLARDSARHAILVWSLAGVLLVAWLFWFCMARLTIYEISSQARLEVNRSVHPIAAPVAGKIVSIDFSLGQQVEAGQVLATLDTVSETLRLQEEQARLTALPPQIEALHKQIAALEQSRLDDQQAALAAIDSARSRQREANAAVSFAKDYERRLSELKGAGKGALIDTLRAGTEVQKLSSARSALSADIQRLQMDAQTHSHQKLAEIEELKQDAAKLSGEQATCRITIDRLREEIEKHRIRAPAAGQIGDIAPLQVGGYVAIGDKLGSVVPHSELRIVAEFPPAAVIGRIKPGQTATMRLDGFPWAQFGTLAATVNTVGSEIRDNRVRVEFAPEPAANSAIVLQHGLPGSVEVVIEQLSPALLVLRKAGQLFDDGIRQPRSSAGAPES
ncbi:HlyD family secretion protein [Methylomonas sp. CM2]|uniref:HlyD family secretion protein n=1 Tax=Methylomonas sp. CM2 TaxID=3417647 RepID=UPI003CF72E4F